MNIALLTTFLAPFLPFLSYLGATTPEAHLLSPPVEAQVNAIASIGLTRSPFINFPDHPLSNTIHGSLLDITQVNKEQNLFHTYAVTSVTFSPDGKRIVSGSADGTLRLWDSTTGKPLGLPFTGHTIVLLSKDLLYKWSLSIAINN